MESDVLVHVAIHVTWGLRQEASLGNFARCYLKRARGVAQ